MADFGLSALATAATLATAAGGVISTVSAVQSSNQQADAAKYEAAQRQANAEGERAAAKRKNDKLLSDRRAVYGASGASFSEGSQLSVLLDQIKESTMEESNISKGATQYAGMKKYEASALKGRIPSQIAGGALSTASSVLGDMYQYGRYSQYGRYRK